MAGSTLTGCSEGGGDVRAGEPSGFIGANAPSLASSSPVLPPSDGRVIATAPSGAVPQPIPVESPTVDTTPVGRADGEEELAGALLHKPGAEFAGVLAASSKQLSEPRRRLYEAYGAALAGDAARARSLSSGLAKSDAISPAERAVLSSALDGAGRGLPASTGAESNAARAMMLALRASEAERMLAAGQPADAARALSEVMLGEVRSPWPSDRAALARWTALLARAQAGYRWNAKGLWPSIQVTVKKGDSLTTIRKRVLAENPALLICTGEIQRVNQLRNDHDLQPGQVLRIPTERANVVADVSARWVFYLHGGEVLAAWEGGVGKEGSETRVGHFTIGRKQAEPMWFRKGEDPVPYGDPRNLLGTRWLSWAENGVETGYGFHGTSDPSGVGGAVSAGCIRMRNEDVELLFEILPDNAEVVVQP